MTSRSARLDLCNLAAKKSKAENDKQATATPEPGNLDNRVVSGQPLAGGVAKGKKQGARKGIGYAQRGILFGVSCFQEILSSSADISGNTWNRSATRP